MRLICTLNDQQQGYTFSNYLKSKGIENEFEVVSNKDWGSNEYGNITCRIWVIDEDQVEEAQKYLNEFQQNPRDPRFKTSLGENKLKSPFTAVTPNKSAQSPVGVPPSMPLPPPTQPTGPVTLYTVILCALLLFYGSLTEPQLPRTLVGVPMLAVESPAVYKRLYFDYPKAFEIADALVDKFGLAKLQNIDDLPPEGKALFEEYMRTPYWQGIYDKLVHHVQHPDSPWDFNAPLFEKERQGQVWRLFTPALLHGNIFHLIFNMLMLIILGRQMEQKMGSGRYLFFILLTGIFSNTAQYFMSGISFLGFSGVLCAMLTFIWFRQKKYPWEGYQLAPSTMAFITIYILVLFTIQFISFVSEAYFNQTFPSIIANTAHISGALFGWVLSKFDFFGLK